MQEVSIKTHLIITDIHNEFRVNWCGRFQDVKPILKNGMPVFILIGGGLRRELNTIDMKHIEEVGKKMTNPRGRQAFTTDKTRIYIKEENGNEKLMCIITHNKIKTFAPMYDSVGYRI